MRFAYNSGDELIPLLKDPKDGRLPNTDFGSYTAEKFSADLLGFNDGRPLSVEQEMLVSESYETVKWLASLDVKFQPIYARQSFEKDGRHVFWGGLTLASDNEGVGLFDQEIAAFKRLGGEIRYSTAVTELIHTNGSVTCVKTSTGEDLSADAVILACGGFEASDSLRKKHIGPNWDKAKVRGTRHNTGGGLVMAQALGAQEYGLYGGCHATPMDLHMKNFGNLDLPASNLTDRLIQQFWTERAQPDCRLPKATGLKLWIPARFAPIPSRAGLRSLMAG